MRAVQEIQIKNLSDIKDTTYIETYKTLYMRGTKLRQISVHHISIHLMSHFYATSNILKYWVTMYIITRLLSGKVIL
jgi:hypothetical protein